MAEAQIQYCTTTDGVSIAFARGGAGPEIVYAPNTFGDIEQATRIYPEPNEQHWIRGRSTIMIDARGTGASQRDIGEVSLEVRLLDVEAVVDLLELRQFTLLGLSFGGMTSIAYAARHPERVNGLVLCQSFADGQVHYERVPLMRMLASFGQMSADQHEFISKTVASAVYGFDNSDAAAELAATLQKAATPDVVHAYRESFRTTDVRPLLGQIRCPTLVLFDRNFMGEDEESSRELARSIPGARLVMFASEGPDQAAATCAEAVDDFLRSIGSVPQAVAATTPKAIPSGMAVVLFTDIADSTGLTERMGDAAFRNHARALDDALRKIITTNGGTPIDGKLLGDGVLATFAAASQAIAAALACDAACDNTPLRLHLGIHAGDVIREQNNVFGGAVNIAARISALAAPGEILVSATVRDLARTSAGVSFEDRGDHALKGIAEPLRVFAVRAAGVGS